MARFGLIALTVAAVSLSLAASASSQTFNGNQHFGTTIASYSITTDGTIGALGPSNITNWFVNLSSGATTTSFASGFGSSISSSALSGLSSDGSNLLYDFGIAGTANPPNYLLFNAPDTSYLCFQSNNCYDTNGGGIGFYSHINNTYGSGGESGVQIIASAFSDVSGVPEPATWAMMLLGFGGIGFAMRRKAAVAQID